MDKGCRLKRLARFLAGESLSGQEAEFLLDDGQESIRGLGISLLDGHRNPRDIAHNNSSAFRISGQLILYKHRGNLKGIHITKRPSMK